MLMAWAKTIESERLSVGFEPIRRKEVSNESKTSKEDTSRFRKKKRYWTKRVIKASFGWKEDHRVVKALQIYHRKRKRKEVVYE